MSAPSASPLRRTASIASVDVSKKALLIASIGLSCGLSGCGRPTDETKRSPEIAKLTPAESPPVETEASSPNQQTPQSPSPSPTRDSKTPPAQDSEKAVGTPMPDDDPDQLRSEGMRALQTGDIDTAYLRARRAMQLSPNDPQIVFLMALVLGERQRFPEAIRMLDQLSNSSAEVRLPALGQTAEWLIQFGRWGEAEQRYRELLNAVPDAAMVHRALAGLLLRQGRRLEAAGHIHRLCQQGDILESELRALLCLLCPLPCDADEEVSNPIGPLGHARQRLATGDWQGVRDVLERVEAPQEEIASLLARARLELGETAAAEAWDKNNSDPDSLNADGWYAKGRLAAENQESANAFSESARCMLRSAMLNPTDPHTYRHAASALAALNRTDDAARLRQRSEQLARTHSLGDQLADAPSDSPLFAELIALLTELDRPLEALSWQAIQLANAHQSGAVSEQQANAIFQDIANKRISVIQSGNIAPDPSSILCGIELDSLVTSPAAE